MNKFTVSEVNLICIFVGNTVMETIQNITTAIPDFTENEMVEIAEQSINKLNTLTESEFIGMNFMENFTDE